MDVEPLLCDGLAGWQYRRPPVTADDLAALTAFEPRLPTEYLALLTFADGGGGELGAEPGWFQLWSAVEAVECNTAGGGYGQVAGHFGIGTNGGGELLAFDLTQSEKPVVMIPLVGMSTEDAVVVARDPVEFLNLLGRSCD